MKQASMVCSCRFVDETMTIQITAGVKKINQFASLKFDDVTFPGDCTAGQKVFVRMAIKQMKNDGGEYMC